MFKRSKKFLVLSLSIMLVTGGKIGLVDSNSPKINLASAQEKTIGTEKIEGKDRYETAINISKYAYSQAEGVIIVSGESLADALSVSPLAKVLDYPVLLTEKDKLNAKTIAEINRLKPSEAIIIGGLSSVSDQVEADLLAMALKVSRVSGSDRSKTSLKIAYKLKELMGDKAFSNIMLVSGKNGIADAAGAGAAAAKYESPLIFIGKYKDEFAFDLNDLSYKQIYLIGGDASYYVDYFPQAKVIYGRDRNDTNLKIAKEFFASDSVNAFVAKNGKHRMEELIDSVAIGGLAGKMNAPVLFVGKDAKLNYDIKDYVKKYSINKLIQVGGSIEHKVEELAGRVFVRPSYKLLNTPYHNQRDAGAPMGCEASSLLMALQAKGYAKDKSLYTFLREMPIASDNNPNHGFASTPFKVVRGVYQSIFPKPMAKWGQNYGRVYDISGSSAEDIRNEIAKGNPVVFFATGAFKPPIYMNYFWGKNAVDNAHVMVVDGYNEISMHIMDPDSKSKSGYWVSNSLFESRYNLKKMAVVVR